ncbi:MAG: hypothetical protein R6U96_01620 [Promethearchaeia archaeon]
MENYSEVSIQDLNLRDAARYLYCLVNRIPIFNILKLDSGRLDPLDLIQFRNKKIFGLNFYKTSEFKKRLHNEKEVAYYTRCIFYCHEENVREWIKFIKELIQSIKLRKNRKLKDKESKTSKLTREDLLRGWVIDISAEYYNEIKKTITCLFPKYLIFHTMTKEVTIKGFSSSFKKKISFERELINEIYQNKKVEKKTQKLINSILPRKLRKDQLISFISSQLTKELEEIEIKSKISNLYNASRKAYLLISKLAQLHKINPKRKIPKISVITLKNYLNLKSERGNNIYVNRILDFINGEWGFNLNEYISYKRSSRAADMISDMF